MPTRMQAISFAFAFQDIRSAYRAAKRALDVEKGTAEAVMRKQFGLPAEGEIPVGEIGEDGTSFADHFWEEVGDLAYEAASAANVVTGAFIIALFHLWERHSNRWLEVKKYDHDATMECLKKDGIKPNEEDLALLQLIANCLKHGPGPSCDKLYKARPDLFELFENEPPSDERLVVTDEMLEHFFTVVLRSGPKATTFPANAN